MLNRKVALRLALGAMASAEAWFRRRPFIVNHLVTVRCNLTCPFCYVSGPEQQAFNAQRYPKRAEMTTAETRDFYRQLVGARYTLAVILGGEPLLRTDLDELLGAIAGHMWVTVFTNGYLLADRHELVRRATNLFVSLDAPDEQHDELRRQPGTFRRALSGIEAVKRHHPKVAVMLNMTVTDRNVARVPDMLRFARQLGVAIGFQPPSYDGCFGLDDRPEQRSKQHLPLADPVAAAFRHIREASRSGARVIGTGSFFRQVIADRPTYACHYPTYVLGPVMPNGDVVGCVDSHVIGNVRTSAVAEITRGAAFRDNAAHGPSCPRGCRDWGIYDLSAIRNRKLTMRDVGSYRRTMLD